MANSKNEVKLTKHDLRRPDAFIRSFFTAEKWVENHAKTVGIFLAVVVVAGCAYFINDWYRTSQETEASMRLFEARLKLQDKSSQTEKLSPDAESAFKAVIEEYPSTKTSTIAAIRLAQLQLQENKSTEAVETLRNVKNKGSQKNLLYNIYYYQYAKTLQMSGDCSAAISEWNTVLANTKLKTFHAESLLGQGLCYEKLGETNKAHEVFNKIINEHAESGAADTARKVMMTTSLRNNK